MYRSAPLRVKSFGLCSRPFGGSGGGFCLLNVVYISSISFPLPSNFTRDGNGSLRRGSSSMFLSASLGATNWRPPFLVFLLVERAFLLSTLFLVLFFKFLFFGVVFFGSCFTRSHFTNTHYILLYTIQIKKYI